MHSLTDNSDGETVFLVRPRPDGERGVFAARALAAGSFIGRFEGEPVAMPTRLSLQVGANLHIEPAADCPLAFLNHACDPSAVFSGRVLVVRRALAAGAELTIDYTCHEPLLAFPFPCECGSPLCVGTVRGWSRLDAVQRTVRRDRAGSWLLPDPEAATRRGMFCRRSGG